MMKKLIISLIISLVLFSSNLWAQSWNEVLVPDFKEDPNEISMVSENEVWIVADGGLIYYTFDGFQTLQSTKLETDADLLKVFFVDENNGWVGSKDGVIYYTNDKGTTWTDVPLDTLMTSGFSFSYFDGLYFVNDTLGFALAGKYKYNYLFKTTDGGLTWSIKDSLAENASLRWSDIEFADENKGVVSGPKSGNLRYTTDGGETWTPADSSVISPMTGSGAGVISWLDDSQVVYMGQGNSFQFATITIFKSTDGGQTWVDKSSAAEGVYDRPKDIFFKDALNGIAVGSNGFSKMFVYKTTDGGDTWVEKANEYAFGLQAIEGSGDILYALGTSGHILKSVDFGETWDLIPFKANAIVEDIFFVDGKGFTVNMTSDVLVSPDGSGQTWNIASSAGIWDAGAMYFFDQSVGLLAKENRGIYKTTDGGSTWTEVLEPVEFSSRNYIGGISFGDSQTGYAWFSIDSYTSYYIYKTTDGGNTWSEIWQTEGPSSPSGGIKFFDANNGFIAGPHVKDTAGVYQNWIVYTEDGGTTWSDATVNGMPEKLEGESLKDVAVLDENTAFAVGSTNFLKTTDRGKTWNYVEHGFTMADTNFYNIAFNGDNGVLANYTGIIFVTSDAGASWTRFDDYDSVYTPSAAAVSENGDVFVGTNNGYILGYYDPTGVEDEPASGLTKDFSLAQNYPNPFNPTTTINFSIPQNEVVTLKIYNVLGQEVKTLINEQMTAGAHKINFDASKLASGVYIYSIKAGSFTAAKKMMLMK